MSVFNDPYMFLLTWLANGTPFDSNDYHLRVVGFHGHDQNESFLQVRIVRDWNY